MSRFPLAEDDGGAVHLLRGTWLPDIALPSTGGGMINLSKCAGRAVVFCYSWTGRPGISNPPDWDLIPGAHGSTPQAEGYRDNYKAFTRQGIAVFGLSLQSTDYQSEMVQRLELPFNVLSDETRAFSDALRLPRFETGGAFYLKRLTIVSYGGEIEKTFYPVKNPSIDAQNIVSWLQGR